MTPSPQPLSRKGERSLFGEAAARLSGAASLLLGWRPDQFWTSTPAELARALQVPAMAEGPDAETIDELRRRFPDE